eukprot:9151728-Pyramimonas_sp.AAC.1
MHLGRGPNFRETPPRAVQWARWAREWRRENFAGWSARATRAPRGPRGSAISSGVCGNYHDS